MKCYSSDKNKINCYLDDSVLNKLINSLKKKNKLLSKEYNTLFSLLWTKE